MSPTPSHLPVLPPPHGGGNLRPLQLTGDHRDEEWRRAQTLPKLRITSREKGDLVMLGLGGFTPLEGFMAHDDWRGVCDDMRTASGVFWPIPITLSTDEATANTLQRDAEVALVDLPVLIDVIRLPANGDALHRTDEFIPIAIGARGRSDDGPAEHRCRNRKVRVRQASDCCDVLRH